MRKILFFSLLIFGVVGYKLRLTLPKNERQCFYERLETGQKYLIDTIPKTASLYRIQVYHEINNEWRNALHRTAKTPFQHFNIHKLASQSASYSFCFLNLEDSHLILTVVLQTGLQLLQFSSLPGKSEADLLKNQIKLLKKASKQILEKVERNGGLLSNSKSIKQMMNAKMISFAIIGVLIIGFTNWLLLKKIKQMLHQRKLI